MRIPARRVFTDWWWDDGESRSGFSIFLQTGNVCANPHVEAWGSEGIYEVCVCLWVPKIHSLNYKSLFSRYQLPLLEVWRLGDGMMWPSKLKYSTTKHRQRMRAYLRTLFRYVHTYSTCTNTHTLITAHFKSIPVVKLNSISSRSCSNHWLHFGPHNGKHFTFPSFLLYR